MGWAKYVVISTVVGGEDAVVIFFFIFVNYKFWKSLAGPDKNINSTTRTSPDGRVEALLRAVSCVCCCTINYLSVIYFVSLTNICVVESTHSNSVRSPWARSRSATACSYRPAWAAWRATQGRRPSPIATRTPSVWARRRTPAPSVGRPSGFARPAFRGPPNSVRSENHKPGGWVRKGKGVTPRNVYVPIILYELNVFLEYIKRRPPSKQTAYDCAVGQLILSTVKFFPLT